MPCTVHNPGVDLLTLPWPFKGMLHGGAMIAFDMTAAQFIAHLGGESALGGLKVADVGPQPAYDTEFLNAAGTGALSIGGGLSVGGSLGVTGDLTAAGGFRSPIGPFGLAAIAASQTAAALDYAGVNGASFIAQRPGSVVGLSSEIDAAVTGAGESATARVTIDGTPIAALDIAFTQAGAEVKGQKTAAKDAYPYVAGARIAVEYDSTAITNTPAMTATPEIEQ